MRTSNAHAVVLQFHFWWGLSDITHDDVLLQIGRSVDHGEPYMGTAAEDAQLVALAHEFVAEPSRETPFPIRIRQRRQLLDIYANGGRGERVTIDATVVVTFRADALAARRHVLEALPADWWQQASNFELGWPGVSAHEYDTGHYVANQDGFSTQRKQGVGTCDLEMVNGFATRIITHSCSRSTRHVDNHCYIPGAPGRCIARRSHLRSHLEPHYRHHRHASARGSRLCQATTTSRTFARRRRTWASSSRWKISATRRGQTRSIQRDSSPSATPGGQSMESAWPTSWHIAG